MSTKPEWAKQFAFMYALAGTAAIIGVAMLYAAMFGMVALIRELPHWFGYEAVPVAFVIGAVLSPSVIFGFIKLRRWLSSL